MRFASVLVINHLGIGGREGNTSLCGTKGSHFPPNLARVCCVRLPDSSPEASHVCSSLSHGHVGPNALLRDRHVPRMNSPHCVCSLDAGDVHNQTYLKQEETRDHCLVDIDPFSQGLSRTLRVRTLQSHDSVVQNTVGQRQFTDCIAIILTFHPGSGSPGSLLSLSNHILTQTD